MVKNHTFLFKPGFKLGVASAATQIEGGDLDHSFNRWYEKGHIMDGTNPARANDHYNLVDCDLKLMKDMGIGIYRLGIEWARIEPRVGEFSIPAIEHYKNLLSTLKKYNIKPLVTLHHFTNPGWFEDMGGFTNKDNIKYYLRFVKRVVTSFDSLANEYITINEPNVYAVNSYLYGIWPPGETSYKKTIQVMNHLALSHIKAYELIHRIRFEEGHKDTLVSFANHVRVFEPKSKYNPWHILCAKLMEYLFQDLENKAFYLGKFDWPFEKYKFTKRENYCDFIAMNYYTRSSVSGFKDGVKEGCKTNDLGWEIYPKGIEECAEKLYALCKKPIYITENGTCDNKDAFRSKYIYEHLKVISESKLPITRYYHWSFTDNFEWIHGESARFGIVHIDYETQERTIKKSGHFYSKIIKDRGITGETYKEFLI